MTAHNQLTNRFLIALLLLAFTPNSQSQIYGKLNHMRPTGVAGYVYQTTIGIEAGQIDDFDGGRFRSRFFVNSGLLRPRLNEFNNVTYYSEGNDFSVLPRVDKFPFNLRLLGGAGFDIMLFETDFILPYFGFDAIGGMEIKKTETGSSSEVGGYVLIGGRMRIGVEKEFDKLSLLLEWSSGITINDERGIFLMNEIGLGIKF